MTSIAVRTKLPSQTKKQLHCTLLYSQNHMHSYTHASHISTHETAQQTHNQVHEQLLYLFFKSNVVTNMLASNLSCSAIAPRHLNSIKYSYTHAHTCSQSAIHLLPKANAFIDAAILMHTHVHRDANSLYLTSF